MPATPSRAFGGSFEARKQHEIIVNIRCFCVITEMSNKRSKEPGTKTLEMKMYILRSLIKKQK